MESWKKSVFNIVFIFVIQIVSNYCVSLALKIEWNFIKFVTDPILILFWSFYIGFFLAAYFIKKWWNKN